MLSLFQRRLGPAQIVLVPLLAVAGATLARLIISYWVDEALPYGPYYPAIAIATIYGGFLCGGFAIILSTLSVAIMYSIVPADPRVEAVALLTFVCASAVVVALCGQLRELTLRLVDITHQLRGSEARLGAVVDQALVGIAEADLRGNITRTNLQLSEIFGVAREELVGSSVYSLLERDDEPQFRALFRKLAENGAGFALEGRCRRGDGAYLWLQIRGSAIQTEDQQAEMVVLVFNDLTSHRRVEESLRAQVREYAG